jgi:hypothetical protein
VGIEQDRSLGSRSLWVSSSARTTGPVGSAVLRALPGAGHGDQACLGADPVTGAAWSSTAAIDPIVDFCRAILR